MIKRKKSKIKSLKNLLIGGNNPIPIQSMLINKTSDIATTISKINELTSYGLDIIRVSILDKEDALSLKEIIPNITIPLVADIHYNLNLAIAAINNGASGIRINPGNTNLDSKEFIEMVRLAKKKNILIRIGLNTGSLNNLDNKQIIKLMLKEIKRYENLSFTNLVLSIKDSSIFRSITLNKMLAKKTNYPLHIGLTEAGDLIDGVVNSTFFFKELLEQGIGDTIRVSLNSNPLDEIRAAQLILGNLNYRPVARIITCPRCGRNTTDTSELVRDVKNYLIKNNINIKIAIMGCNVNGPGESKDALIGVYPITANKFIIYYNKEKYKEVNNNDCYDELVKLIDNI